MLYSDYQTQKKEGKMSVQSPVGNMAHQSEINSGSASLAVNLRTNPAWHSFANKVFNQDEPVTTAQMLDGAKLSNWNIQLDNFAPCKL